VNDQTRVEARLDEERLADLVADVAEQIARGESPDIEDLESRNPSLSKALQRLLPAIRLLSEMADEEATEDRSAWFTRPTDVLGDFELGREIGRGEIGVVYEARQLSLGRRVALKVLPPSALHDPRQLRRFEIEAQAAALLQHPNIIPVFAFGTERGVPYFAMRLIDGRNLAELVEEARQRKGRGFHPREAAELARQAAEALDYAHRNEVLHRDVKPSNFLVDAQERLWIADFGLARVRVTSDLTASGDSLGTLRYLSPEQVKGRREAVDGRSDVYGLGATLYELLTLRPVFEGDDRAELLIRIQSDEPRFSHKLDTAIPLDLKTIALKALAKDPSERYATAGDLAGDLTLFLANLPIRARPPTTVPRLIKLARRRWRALVSAGLIAATILIGIAAAALCSNSRLRAINQRLQNEIDRADNNALEARNQALTSERHAFGTQLRLAALALETAQPERAQEILRDIPLNSRRDAPRSFVWRDLWRRSRRDVVVLVGPTPQFGGMALSLDGKLLATTDGSAGLELWNVVTGERIRTIDMMPGQHGTPVFSPDGLLVAVAVRNSDVASPDGFSIWEVASGRQLARLPMGQGFDTLSCNFLPDGVFLGSGGGANIVPAHVARAWTLADLPAQPRLLNQFDFSPDMDSVSAGGALLTLENHSTVFRRDSSTGKPIREFRVEDANENIIALTCSKGAHVLAAVSEPSLQLRLWDGQTGKLLAAHALPEQVVRLHSSPDGSAVAAIDRSGGVHLIERASGVVRQLISSPADRPRQTLVAFSGDGSRLAIALARPLNERDPDPLSIWETATGRRLANFPGPSDDLRHVVFTPDGHSLLISSQFGVRKWRLVPLESDQDRQPAGHKDEAWSLAFAPDGRTLATGSDDSEPDSTIKLWESASSRLTFAWHGGSGTVASLAFSPDGRTLASGHLVASENVRIWDAATGRSLATLDGHTDRVRSVTFARDGKCLATGSSDGTVRLWDVASWRQREVLRGNADTVHAVAFSPDGKTLASAGNDGDIRLWDLRSDEGPSSQARVLHNRAKLMALAFAPDGKTLAVADSLGSVTVWDLDRSTPIRLIHSDRDELHKLAFNPDGTALAAAGIKGLIHIWDPATGQELVTMAAHRARINGLAFSPDGSILSSVAHDGSVRLWRAEP
jgi:WD40 repeat protein/serine/threonine protein kinase